MCGWLPPVVPALKPEARGQERVTVPLLLVSHPMWVLGTEAVSSLRATRSQLRSLLTSLFSESESCCRIRGHTHTLLHGWFSCSLKNMEITKCLPRVVTMHKAMILCRNQRHPETFFLQGRELLFLLLWIWKWVDRRIRS